MSRMQDVTQFALFEDYQNGIVTKEGYERARYMFLYYMMFYYDGVSYTMYPAMPSGSVIFPASDEEYATATVIKADGKTTIKITTSYGYLDNRIICNGTEYQYTTYTDKFDSTATLVLDGEQTVVTVTLFFTEYGTDYETYSGEITMKGNMYKQIMITTVNEEILS